MFYNNSLWQRRWATPKPFENYSNMLNTISPKWYNNVCCSESTYVNPAFFLFSLSNTEFLLKGREPCESYVLDNYNHLHEDWSRYGSRKHCAYQIYLRQKQFLSQQSQTFREEAIRRYYKLVILKIQYWEVRFCITLQAASHKNIT